MSKLNLRNKIKLFASTQLKPLSQDKKASQKTYHSSAERLREAGNLPYENYYNWLRLPSQAL